MRQVRTPLVIGAVALVVAGRLAAQDKIALQQKFTPEQELAYAISMTGVGGMEVTGAPGGNGVGDIFMDVFLDMRQRTRSVDEEGIGEVALFLDHLRSTVQAFGMDQVFELEQGHVRMRVNDQVVFDSAEAEPGEGNPFAWLAFLDQGIVMRIDATGKLVALPQFALLKNLIPGMEDFDIEKLLAMGRGDFPTHPVAVGDTWEVVQPIPFFKVGGEEPPAVKTVHTLEALEQVQGRECAKITSVTELRAGGMSLQVPRLMGPPQVKVQVELRALEMEQQQTRWFDHQNGLDVKAFWDMSISIELEQTLEFTQEGEEKKVEMELKLENLDLMGEMELTGEA